MSTPTRLDPLNQINPRPFVRIVEQPSKHFRYRYINEGRCGTIPGRSSTAENRTSFTVEVVGYTGRVGVVVSCVTQSLPYRPHPHCLSGTNCKNGYYVHRKEITSENRLISFPQLGIQCVKRNDVIDSLRIRQEKNVDPFKTGFPHRKDVRSIDLKVLRLCVQIFLIGEGRDIVGALTPVVSDPIHNKIVPDPLIMRLSSCKCCVNGNINGKEQDIFLLCAKMAANDIQIRFYEVKDGRVVWQDYGRFQANGVFNNTAICFRPPKYYNQEITDPVGVFVQLVRPSDNVVSPSVEFGYLPLDTEPGALTAKRMEKSFCLELMRFVERALLPETQATSPFTALGSNSSLLNLNPSHLNALRRESQGRLPGFSHFQNLAPFNNSPSTSRKPSATVSLAVQGEENSESLIGIEPMSGNGQPQASITAIEDNFTMGSNSNLLNANSSHLNVSAESQECLANLPQFRNLYLFDNSPSTFRGPTPSASMASDTLDTESD